MKKRILVISQYFFPEQFRINDISTEWVKRGYKVTVLTGIPNYPQGRYYKGYGLVQRRKEKYNGVDVIRIPLIPRGNNNIALVLNYLSFVLSGFFWNIFTNIRSDYVFIFEVSPMTQALIGVWYAKRRKIPCYIYVQDLWPENVEILSGISNKIVFNGLNQMVEYIYKSCDRIFATSGSFVESIQKHGIKREKIQYWPQYAEDFYKPLSSTMIPEIPDDDAFNIIYAGNIGTAQGIDILVEAAEIISRRITRRVRFNIVGDGRYKKELIFMVRAKSLSDTFNFIPKQPPTRIPLYIARNDVAFLSFIDNPIFAMTIPAKLPSLLACGIPLLASAAGETCRIVMLSKSGLCSKPGDAKELANNIIIFLNMEKKELEQLRSNARVFYEQNFNKQTLLSEMDLYFGANQPINRLKTR